MENTHKQKVTLKDLERYTGLSVATISRALNNTGYVSVENRKLILEAQLELGYVPQKHRSGMSSLPNTVLLILPDNKTPFWFEFMRGVQDICKKYEYFTALYFVAPDENEARTILKVSSTIKVRGCIVVTLNANSHLSLAMTQLELPRVLCAAHRIDNDDAISRNYDCISVDSQKGTYLSTSHLAETGRKRIAFLGLNDSVTGTQRLQGYQAALHVHGLEVHKELISLRPEPECYENGYEFIMACAKNDCIPDGVCAVNDKTALGVMQACRQLGIKIPDQLGLVGMDNTDYATSVTPTLSSVDLAPYDLGRFSAQRLFHRMRDPNDLFRNTVLEPNLNIRESSAGL